MSAQHSELVHSSSGMPLAELAVLVAAVAMIAAGVLLASRPPEPPGAAGKEPVPIAAGAGNPYAAYFNARIPAQLDTYGIAGAVVAVVQGGEPVFMQGYGYANVEQHIPMDAERSIVHIGSAGKTFTAVAVMQLVDQGLIDLDADVNTYLDFEIPATYAEPITIRHLLTHTAGFEAHDLNVIVVDPGAVPSSREFLVRNLPERISPPGEVVGYSNYGLALLGYVVERVSSEPLALYLDRHILEPLEMAHSSAQMRLPEALAADMAVGYANGQPQPAEYIAAYGAAPVRATAADMARYLIANLQQGQAGQASILQPDTARSMQARQFSAAPGLNGTGFGFYELSRNGQRVVGHLGTTSFFHSLLFMLPEEDLGVMVSYNSAEAASLLPTGVLLQDFMDHFYPRQVGYLTPPAGFDARADEYAGVYFLNTRHAMSTAEKALFLTDAARVHAPGDGTLRLTMGGVTRAYVEIAPDDFQRQGGDERLVFHRGPDGQVDSASLSSRPVFTLVKRPWYEAPRLSLAALASTAGICLLGMVAAAISLWAGRHGTGGLARAAQWLALATAALNLIALLGLGLCLLSVGRGLTENALRLVLALPVLAAVLTLALLGVTGALWARAQGTLAARLCLSLLGTAGIVQALVLHIWNLLGWRL